MQYLLKEGNTNVPNYGLLLAEVAGLPPPILKEAREIADAFNNEVCQEFMFAPSDNLKLGFPSYMEVVSLDPQQEAKRSNDSHAKHLLLRKDYRAVQRLLCLQYSTLSEQNVRDYLQGLKDEYLDRQV